MNTELAALFDRLPEEIGSVIAGFIDDHPDIQEIRIRSDKNLSFLCGDRNITVHYRITKEMMERILAGLCENSVHSYMETIKKGYISLPHGLRVGVCGRAFIRDEEIEEILDVSSLNVRIPADVRQVAYPVFERLKESGFSASILLYSPPGGGKTTVLRDLAALLCDEGNKRVCLLDERMEICRDSLARLDNLDVFSGYPKDVSMEIAVRTMSPEYILCDEIGGLNEVYAWLAVQNAGVPLIATAHAGGVGALLRKSGIRMLHNAGVFDYYVGIRREGGRVRYLFCDAGEIDSGVRV